jgi:hypothetical protein
MTNSKRIFRVIIVLMSLLVAGLVMAQPPQDNRGPGRGGFRNLSPEERQKMMEERMSTRMKEQLEITDAEWTALKPFFQKVTDLSRQVAGGGRGGMMGGRRGGRGGRGGPDDPQANAEPRNDVEKYGMALDKLLDSENPNPEEIKAKLTDFRNARAKVEQDLIKAQSELRALLTIKQEARLVRMGLLK